MGKKEREEVPIFFLPSGARVTGMRDRVKLFFAVEYPYINFSSAILFFLRESILLTLVRRN